jgi:Na+/proline symporter
MEFNVRFLIEILIVAVFAEVISLQTVQMVKALIPKQFVKIFALVFNIILGVLMVVQFTNQQWIIGLWVGFFSWIGAELLYKSLEKGIRLAGHTELTYERKLNDALDEYSAESSE